MSWFVHSLRNPLLLLLYNYATLMILFRSWNFCVKYLLHRLICFSLEEFLQIALFLNTHLLHRICVFWPFVNLCVLALSLIWSNLNFPPYLTCLKQFWKLVLFYGVDAMDLTCSITSGISSCTCYYLWGFVVAIFYMSVSHSCDLGRFQSLP